MIVKNRSIPLLFLIVFEIGFILFLSTCNHSTQLWASISLISSTLGLLIYTRKTSHKKLISIYSLFHNRYSSSYGFAKLLVIIINLGLLADATHELASATLKNEISSSIIPLCLCYLSFFGLFFLLPVAEHKSHGKISDRKVLISPVSKWIYNTTPHATNIELVKNDTSFEFPKNLIPIKLAFDFYKKNGASLRNILLFTNKEVDDNLAVLMKEFNHKHDKNYSSPIEFLKSEFFNSENLNLNIRQIQADINDLKDYFKEVEQEVKAYTIIKDIEEKNLTFFLTPGNKIASISLAILSIPSERGALYLHQKTSNKNASLEDLEEVDLSVLNMKMLWDELLNKLGDKEE
ncbi:hypothetical protein SAMN06298216_3545 [Spirosomataceae bacterium TFI 002]|nr:hypothetical protein SAMN06298216_3545 [Spirosomataceae bacterium TFI 002]